MLTAPAKQWQQQEIPQQAASSRKTPLKIKKKSEYGFHKFCALVIGFAFVLGILLLAEHALVISKGYKIIAVKKEITALKTSNDRLQLKIAQLKDLKRVEYVALAKLGMVKPGDDAKEFMDIRPEPIQDAPQKVAEIKVEPKPGKTVNPVVNAFNLIVKDWISQAAIQINPKG